MLFTSLWISVSIYSTAKSGPMSFEGTFAGLQGHAYSFERDGMNIRLFQIRQYELFRGVLEALDGNNASSNKELGQRQYVRSL